MNTINSNEQGETKYIVHTYDLMAQHHTRTFKNLNKAIEYLHNEREYYATSVIENDRHFSDGTGNIDDENIAWTQKNFFYIEQITKSARLDY